MVYIILTFLFSQY